MASEAARQKYPDPARSYEQPLHGIEVAEIRREAYDAGRVDALRDAAERIDRHPWSEYMMATPGAMLRLFADRIEKEARG